MIKMRIVGLFLLMAILGFSACGESGKGKCPSGMQDNDHDGLCKPDCQTANLSCGHGSCSDSSGTALCVCESGYAGTDCSRCDVGYHEEGGLCVVDKKCQTNSCSGHGNCDDTGGVIKCTCDTGYTGEDCSACAEGYQDNDGDKICLPDCATEKPDCTSHGHCDDSNGTAICVCDEGYAGLFCETCAPGYQDNDGNKTCWPDCEHSGLNCGEHGSCSDADGQAACICQEGYSGEFCRECAPGWQDNDHDQDCEKGCALSGLNCGTYGTCSDESGTPHCVCYEGYAGADCRSCATGYQDNDGNGTCHPNCQTANLSCVHGSCDDSEGLARCVCQIGWAGDNCDRCANGYQDNDDNQTCEPNCATAALSCGTHGHCDDSSGTAHCECDEGYAGSHCNVCAAGYQDSDQNGSCLPDCLTSGYQTSCAEGGHGSCGYSGGEVVCICDFGYNYDGQGHCVYTTGFNCDSPISLPLANGSYQGNTVGAGDDAKPGCVSYSTAPELVYYFQVIRAVHVKFITEGFDTVVYLRSVCNDPQSQIACNDDDGPGSGSLIEADLQPGTYYLFVDGWGSYAGSFTLTVEVSCGPGFVYDPQSGECVDDPCLPNPCNLAHQTVCEPVPPNQYICHCEPGYIDDPQNPGSCILDPNPTGESCASVIYLDVVDQGSVNGSTVNAQNDATGTCAGAGPDRVYGFTLNQRMRVQFDMTGYDTVLHLRRSCADAQSEVACDDDSGDGTNARIGPLVLEPGSYYLWADSYNNGGNFTLIYSFRADPCANEEAVCPGTPVCQATPDWSSYQCVCPAGYLPFQGDCVDDPCDPNPCTEPNRNRCQPDLPGAYFCRCNIGYIDDPQNPGICIVDPNANEWLVMIYLNADSNLSSAGLDDLGEMMHVGSTPYVHIVVLIDTAESGAEGHGRKLYVRQGSYDVIQDLGEIDMGDWRTLRDFGVWAVQNYPARHHALIMWDHGSGWDKKGKEIVGGYKGFSYDYASGNHISVAGGQYEQALAGIVAALGDKLDLIGHDECLMGMWEVASASAPYGRYFVASEETEPGDGWAYDVFLRTLVDNPQGTTAEILGRAIVESYYNSGSDFSTLSLVDLESMGQLHQALNAFADQLRANSQLNTQIDSVRSNTQDFYESDHRDLKHFAQGIAAMNGAPAGLVAAAQALITQLDSTIVYNRAQASGYAHAYGMAIYLPSRTSTPDSSYLTASWCQLSTWDEFLQAFNK